MKGALFQNRFWLCVLIPVWVGLAICIPILVHYSTLKHEPVNAWYFDTTSQTYMYKGDNTLKGSTTIFLPDEYLGRPITVIGANAFKDFKNLKSVTLPAGLTAIYDNAFFGCEKLASINIPDGVNEIRSGAFQNCTGLTSVKLPSVLHEISGWVFQGCTSLSSITLPANIMNLGTKAFKDSSLKNITIMRTADIVNICADTFGGCTLENIYLPDIDILGLYWFNPSVVYWAPYKDILKIIVNH